MPDDPIAEQAVLQNLPGSYVVDHYMPQPVRGSSPGYNADMGDTTTQVPADDVARLVIVRLLRHGQDRPMPGEERHQIGNPPVVYVLVRPGEPPVLRVTAEVVLHVLVNFLLQIDPEFPVGPDHHIGADAPVRRHITVGIGYSEVGRVIANVLLGKDQCRVCQLQLEALLCTGERCPEQNGPQEQSGSGHRSVGHAQARCNSNTVISGGIPTRPGKPMNPNPRFT